MGALDNLLNKKTGTLPKYKKKDEKTSALDALLKGNKPAPSQPKGLDALVPQNTRTVSLPDHLGGGEYKVSDKPGELVKTERSQDALPPKGSIERDHIISVALGGTSGEKNLQYLATSDKGRQEGKVSVEQAAINDYVNGKISLNEARLRVAIKQQQIKGLTPTDEEQTVKGQLTNKYGKTLGGALNFLGKAGDKIFGRNKEEEAKAMRFEVGEGLSEEPKPRIMGLPQGQVGPSEQVMVSDKDMARGVVDWNIATGAQERANLPMKDKIKALPGNINAALAQNKAINKTLTPDQQYQRYNPYIKAQAKAASDALGEEIKAEDYIEREKTFNEAERQLIDAYAKEDRAELNAKVATAPIRFLAGYPAVALVSYALEVADEDKSFVPKTDLEKLLVGDMEVKRILESEDMYGMIARSLGIPLTLGIMAVIENPFIAGTGVKPMLKNQIKRQSQEQIARMGMKEFIKMTEDAIKLELKHGRITRETAEQALKEVGLPTKLAKDLEPKRLVDLPAKPEAPQTLKTSPGEAIAKETTSKPQEPVKATTKPKTEPTLDDFSETTKEAIPVYRGEGKGIGNSTLVDGKYYADSEEFASTFGKVIKEKIPAGSKVFNLDKVKGGDSIIAKELLVDPPKLTRYLIENGFDVTKNTNTRGVEYVILNKKQNELFDLALKSKNVDSFNIKLLKEWDSYREEIKRLSGDPMKTNFPGGKSPAQAIWDAAQKSKLPKVSQVIKAEKATKETVEAIAKKADQNVKDIAKATDEALIRDAKKYKSADEWVKNIPNNSKSIVFHQTGNKQAEKILKEGFVTGKFAEKRGAVYAAGNTINDKLYSRTGAGELFSGQEAAKIAIDIRGLNLYNATKHGISDEMGSAIIRGDLSKLPKGYDGAIKYLKNGDVYEVALPKAIADKRILTKEQLVDIWNQAQKSAKKPALPKAVAKSVDNNPIIMRTSIGDEKKVYRLKDFADKDGYVYHTTSPNNLKEIRKSGLKLSEESYQGKGVYFAPDEASTIGQASYEGMTVRVNLDNIDPKHITGADVTGFGDPTELVYGKAIPASAIEVKTKNGWKPLAENTPAPKKQIVPKPKAPVAKETGYVSIKKLEVPEFNNGKEINGWHDVYAKSDQKTRDKMDKDINYLLKDKNNELEPILIRRDGKFIDVEDGHHRVASYISAGRENIPTKIVKADKPAMPKPATKTTDEFSTHYEKIKKEFGFSDNPEYFKATTNKELDKKAFDYIQKNPQKAMRIAYGMEKAPAGQNLAAIQRSMMVALKDKGKLVQAEEIGRRLSKELTEAGQSLNVAKMDVGPRGITKEITDARLKRIGEKLTDKPEEAIEAARKKIKGDAKKASQEIAKKTKETLKKIKFEEIDAMISKIIC